MEALRDRVESNPVLIYAQAHSAGDSHDDGLSPPNAAAQVRVKSQSACLPGVHMPAAARGRRSDRVARPAVDAQP
jgi:hypothetical protein